MNLAKLYLLLILIASSTIGNAREKNYDISAPTNLPETGVNKVLYMKNGNTMLFHFEPNKKIRVLVFDSLHKQIANNNITSEILNTTRFYQIIFKGLYEINNEAVLFFDQDRDGKHSLVRLRYSATDGHLAAEDIVEESKNEGQKIDFYVMKNKGDDNYSILYSMDNSVDKECALSVNYFDKLHHLIKEVPLSIDRKKYDYLVVTGAEAKPNGVAVSLDLAVIDVRGTGRSAPTTYNHHLMTFYIPANSSTAYTATAHLSPNVYPLFTNYTYNPFAKKLNLLLLSYCEIQYKYDLEWLPDDKLQHILFTIDEGDMALDYKWITNKLANDQLKQNTDTTAFFDGIPITVHTNDNGLSTMVSESFSRYWEPENRIRTGKYTYLGNIGITQYDDNGNEVWGTVLPITQRYRSLRQYYSAYELSKKWQHQFLFDNDLPDAVYERQFVSIAPYFYHKNLYIIYNDNNRNFNNSIEHPGDTVYNFNTTNTCYYKVTDKKETTKHYLFGDPRSGEYKTSLVEGADFDEQTGMYVSLIQYKKGNDISLRMAWCHLD